MRYRVAWTSRIPALLEKRSFWTVLLIATTIFAFLLNFYGIERDLMAITPHLLYIPIVIAAYWFPRHGVTLTVGIAMGYLAMIYLIGYPHLELLTQATAYFYVFVAIGVIVASLSGTQKEQERRYHGIFDYSEAGVFLVVNLRSGPVLEEVNTRGAEILGYRAGELAGTAFLDLFAVQAEKEEVMARIARGGAIADVECHLRRKDGAIVHGLLSAGPLPGRRTVFTLVDITERKRAEEELKASQSQYVAALDAMMDGIFLVDEGGRIVLINSTFRRWLARIGHGEGIIGKSAGEIIACLEDPVKKLINDVFSSGETRETTIRYPFKGRDYSLDTRFIPVFENGKVARVMVVMRDVTKAQQIEEEKRRAYEQIEKNIEQFAVLGDHIRNPIQVIIGLADLEGGPFAEKIREQARDIDRTVAQLDQGWVESEKIREFIRKYYGVGK
ncbi:MAG: PAS domain-containing protein [Methanolinea sp.]|nr:PAS domain-containing protein [Methanolinea sp.]